MGNHRDNGFEKVLTVLLIVIIVICFIICAVLFRHQRQLQAEGDQVLAEVAEKYSDTDSNAAAAVDTEDTENTEDASEDGEAADDSSVYEKLAAGEDVDILIVGDSIASGSGADETYGKNTAWDDLLAQYLREEYLDGEDDGTLQMTNVALGGNTTYAAYVRALGNVSEYDTEYDLVIICSGLNDESDTLSLYYEAMIRAAEESLDCSVIGVLESYELKYMDIPYMNGNTDSADTLSEENYSERAGIIREICDYYEVPAADTIAAFVQSGTAYEDLTDEDGNYPNNDGQEIYAQTILDVIEENVEAATGKPEVRDPYNKGVKTFTDFTWYAAGNTRSDGTTEFLREDDTTYTLDIEESGALGIYYTTAEGDNNIQIYLDDELYTEITNEDMTYEAKKIQLIGRDVEIGSQIRVVFGSAEQADNFSGMCISTK